MTNGFTQRAEVDMRTPDDMRRSVVMTPLRVLPLWVLLLIAPAFSLAGASTWNGVIAASTLMLAWMVLDVGLGLARASGLPTWWRAMSIVIIVLALVSRILDAEPTGGPGWNAVLGTTLFGCLLAALWYDVTAAVSRTSPPLRWPLPSGRWLVIQGTNRVLNHHWRVPRQRAALDIVGLDSAGRSFQRSRPRHFDDFVIAGALVTSPVDGVVIVVSDDAPMWPQGPQTGVAAAGNHVVIDGGTCRVLLAHMVPGSILVAIGERVTAGDPIGSVGTSGNSTQPHLHIHAIDDDGPLRLVFDGIAGRHRRGSVITT